MDSISVVTITDRELGKHLEDADRKIRSFPVRVAPPPREGDGSASLGGRRIAYRPLQRLDAPSVESELSLAGRIQEIVPRDDLYTDVEHHVLRVIRRGIQVFAEVYESYARVSGLARLKAANREGSLAAGSEPELEGKVETACAAGMAALWSYVLARLLDAPPEDREGLDFELVAPDDLSLRGKSDALHASLHYLYRAVDAHARDDDSLVRAVREAARQLGARLRDLQGSLQHLEFYTRYHYRIEPEEVVIAGFELPERHARSEIQVPIKRPEEVVGNHVAKLEAGRIAQRLACYDLAQQRNPFVELGGFTFTFIGDGQPGTGKTTLIQMMVTLLRGYAEVAGLPLRYENFSIDQISDYQGRSGQNAKRFCQGVLDPRGLGFGTIDDVDQVCGNRGDRHASAGQLEVTAVFMQEFAGANTVVRGNASFGLFSNYPEKVDGALRQRTQARFQIDGPRTRDDFADLFHILLAEDWELPRGDGYEPLAAQRVHEVIREKYAEHDVPRSAALRSIFDEIAARRGARSGPSSWRDFGEYLHALQEHDARFTGRAVKNVADALRARAMDFDLPAEWLEKREVFFAKPYDTRVGMIRELRGQITPETAIQEINRYADSEARYADAADSRELEERTRQIELEARARKAAAEREG